MLKDIKVMGLFKVIGLLMALALAVFLTIIIHDMGNVSVPGSKVKDTVNSTKDSDQDSGGEDDDGADEPILNSAESKVHQIEVPKDRVAFLVGEVDMGSTGLVAKQILAMEKESTKPIYLLINSPGGSVMAGSMLLTVIENSKAPVYTVCAGLCASMGAIIFSYGKQRMSVDRSVLMFHDAAGGGFQGDIPKVSSQVRFIEQFVTKLNAKIAKRAKMDLRDFQVMVSRNIWIDGEEAVSLGLADKRVALHLSPDLVTKLDDSSERSRALLESVRY